MSVKQNTKAPPAIQTRYLKESEAAAIDGFSLAWHQKKRWEGGGPPYIKVGRSVRYPEHTLLEWMQSGGKIAS